MYAQDFASRLTHSRPLIIEISSRTPRIKRSAARITYEHKKHTIESTLSTVKQDQQIFMLILYLT